MCSFWIYFIYLINARNLEHVVSSKFVYTWFCLQLFHNFFIHFVVKKLVLGCSLMLFNWAFCTVLIQCKESTVFCKFFLFSLLSWMM